MTKMSTPSAMRAVATPHKSPSETTLLMSESSSHVDPESAMSNAFKEPKHLQPGEKVGTFYLSVLIYYAVAGEWFAQMCLFLG